MANGIRGDCVASTMHSRLYFSPTRSGTHSELGQLRDTLKSQEKIQLGHRAPLMYLGGSVGMRARLAIRGSRVRVLVEARISFLGLKGFPELT